MFIIYSISLSVCFLAIFIRINLGDVSSEWVRLGNLVEQFVDGFPRILLGLVD